MFPGTLLATALTLSLVPGWLFLRLTERVRRPRIDSSLHELLELIAVGVATTGLAAVLGVIFESERLKRLAWPPKSAVVLRNDGLAVLAIFALALVFTVVSAYLVRCFSASPQAELSLGVWWDTFRADDVPKGHVPYVSLTLTDNRGVVEGVLHSYTWQPNGDHRRDIAIRAPIRYPVGENAKGERLYRKPRYDRLVIDADEIQEIALTYQPKSGKLAKSGV